MPIPTRAYVLTILLGALLIVGCGTQDETAQASADCEKLSGPFEKIECYVSLAGERGDARPCSLAQDDGVRYQCYAIVAERLNDRSLCDEIPLVSDEHRQLRDLCISDVAKVNDDPEMCRELSEAGLRDSCLLAIAQATGRVELCTEIQDAGLKSLCTGEPVQVE